MGITDSLLFSFVSKTSFEESDATVIMWMPAESCPMLKSVTEVKKPASRGELPIHVLTTAPSTSSSVEKVEPVDTLPKFPNAQSMKTVSFVVIAAAVVGLPAVVDATREPLQPDGVNGAK